MWHIPPLCLHLIARPSCQMGPRASRNKKKEKSHKRVRVRGNKRETGSVQSTFSVLSSLGSTEREKLLGCGGCRPQKNDGSSTAIAAMVPIRYNCFDGNGAVEGPTEELSTNCVRDHLLSIVVPSWTRVPSSTWVVTVTTQSLRRLSPRAMVPNGAFIRTMNFRFVTKYMNAPTCTW